MRHLYLRIRITALLVGASLLYGSSLSAADAKHSFGFEASAHADLAKRAEALAKSAPGTASLSADITAFRDHVRNQIKQEQPARWKTGSKGNVVGIYVIYFQGETPPSIGWAEEVRDSLFAGGLKTVAQLAGTIGGVAAAATELAISKEAHVLQEERATVTVDVPTEKARNTATITDAIPDYVVVIDLTTNQEPKKHAPQQFVLLTGPREGFFWTADLPVNRVKQLKLDNGTIKSRDEGPGFYVGLDYTFGDAATTPVRFRDAVTIKGLIKASKQPLDSVGVALALRAGYFKKGLLENLGLDLSAFSPFVGVTFTREDQEAVEGEVTKTGRNSEFRAGIGFDIGTALKWIKKPATAKTDGAAAQPVAPAAPTQPTQNPNGPNNAQIPTPPNSQE